MSHPTLRTPPIREALIDIQLAVPVDLPHVERIAEKFSARFPRKQTLREGIFELKFSKASDVTAKTHDSATIGYRLDSEDGSRVLQARVRGFTFSILKGYTAWEVLREEAHAAWGEFVAGVGDTSVTVTRVATRFINVLQLPPPPIDFDDFLTCAPRVPRDLPQVLSGFFQQITIPLPDKGFTAIVTHALETPTESATPVVLDIDVFHAQQYPASDDGIWHALDAAREIKNQVFFSSITDRALELFR